MSLLTPEQLQHIGKMWAEDCPDLVGLALTGEPDGGTVKGLIKALDICEFTGKYLNLEENPEWLEDVILLRQALNECRWYAYANA